MTFEQYVAAGQKARQQEEQAGWKLAELAAGVEREHGALTRWADGVGISPDRARKMRQAWSVRHESGDAAALSVGAAEELYSMPALERGQFLAANPKPSMREARAAAEPYRKTQKTREEYSNSILVNFGTAKDYAQKGLVELRDTVADDETTRIALNMLDGIEAVIGQARDILASVPDYIS